MELKLHDKRIKEQMDDEHFQRDAREFDDGTFSLISKNKGGNLAVSSA